MNMKQFRYVLVLADEGSFSKAADTLNISQPSLSQYVKKIETQLGVELFDRANGNVRLTDAGRIYIDAGKKILDLEHQMQTKFSDIAEYKTGSLIIGTTPFRSVTMMPAVLAEFKKIYPGIHVVIDERNTQELNEAIEKGEFDFCILTLPIDERKFCYELIMEEELVIAVPQNSALSQKLCANSEQAEERRYPVIDVSLLNHEEFVMITEAQVMQKHLNNLCLEHGLELKKAAVVKSLEAQIAMVRRGIGAALVPTGILEVGEIDEKVNYFSLKQELPFRQVVVIYRKEQYLSKVQREFIDIMKKVYEKK